MPIINENVFYTLTFLPEFEDLLFSFYILMRVLGLLIVSPLLSNRAINPAIRLFLAIFITLLLTMVLYPDYKGAHSRYRYAELQHFTFHSLPEVILISIKELGIGYIIGFCFNVVFEAMVLAGELIDSMIGFSTAQFLDPFSNSVHSLLGHLLVLFGALMMLIVDLHHIFIRVVAESFNLVPIGNFELTRPLFDDITLGTSWIFVYGLKFGSIPILILACGLVGIAFTVRVVPEMNLLLTGLPMRVLLGFFTMILATGRIMPIFKESFTAVTRLAEQILHHFRFN
jgi:flagellar biosynthetic protein FliR